MGWSKARAAGGGKGGGEFLSVDLHLTAEQCAEAAEELCQNAPVHRREIFLFSAVDRG